jgi:hypothetical protein
MLSLYNSVMRDNYKLKKNHKSNYIIYRLLKDGTRSGHRCGKIGCADLNVADKNFRLNCHFYGSSMDIYEGTHWELLDYLPNTTRQDAEAREKQLQEEHGVLDGMRTNVARQRARELLKRTPAQEENRIEASRRTSVKPANIYDATTHELVAEGINLREWALANFSGKSAYAKLNETAHGRIKAYRGYYVRR